MALLFSGSRRRYIYIYAANANTYTCYSVKHRFLWRKPCTCALRKTVRVRACCVPQVSGSQVQVQKKENAPEPYGYGLTTLRNILRPRLKANAMCPTHSTRTARLFLSVDGFLL